jgi:hypothetical protein
VAGGIPVIKGLKEGVAANEIRRVYGILNGTCNYILSTMEDTGRDFADVLAEAQAKGYAEADPTFDIDGIDAAHKLAILSSVASAPDRFQGRRTTGIRRIVAADIAQADVLGYYIRLIGMADTEVDAAGKRRLFQRVQPTWSTATIRWPMSMARPMPWWPKAISWAACCSRAPARGWPHRQRGGGRPHRHRARRHRRAFLDPRGRTGRSPRQQPATASAAPTCASPSRIAPARWPRSPPRCAMRASRSKA